MAFTVSYSCLYHIVLLHLPWPIHVSSLGHDGIHCDHIHVSILQYYDIDGVMITIMFVSLSYSTMDIRHHIHVFILQYYGIHCIVFVPLSYHSMAFAVIIFMSLSYSTIQGIHGIIFMSLFQSTMAFTLSHSCLCRIVLWHSQ